MVSRTRFDTWAVRTKKLFWTTTSVTFTSDFEIEMRRWRLSFATKLFLHRSPTLSPTGKVRIWTMRAPSKRMKLKGWPCHSLKQKKDISSCITRAWQTRLDTTAKHKKHQIVPNTNSKIPSNLWRNWTLEIAFFGVQLQTDHNVFSAKPGNM